MQCRSCGTEIADKALICYRCGTAVNEPVSHPAPVARRRRRPLIIAVLIAAVLAIIAFFFGDAITLP
jgi:uncharacterized membrane protein YvbJ